MFGNACKEKEKKKDTCKKKIKIKNKKLQRLPITFRINTKILASGLACLPDPSHATSPIYFLWPSPTDLSFFSWLLPTSYHRALVHTFLSAWSTALTYFFTTGYHILIHQIETQMPLPLGSLWYPYYSGLLMILSPHLLRTRSAFVALIAICNYIFVRYFDCLPSQ